ncbi:hypothetical protein TNCV_2016481 [Trichonephila clavipes]|nr:hypothetical protein TNCV_2016481 [Trichonephila clavipes]
MSLVTLEIELPTQKIQHHPNSTTMTIRQVLILMPGSERLWGFMAQEISMSENDLADVPLSLYFDQVSERSFSPSTFQTAMQGFSVSTYSNIPNLRDRLD